MSSTEPADDAAQNANDTAETAGPDAAGQGPPVDLPDQAPDFVSDILDEVSAGATDLGETISEIASNANPAELVGVAGEVATMIPL